MARKALLPHLSSSTEGTDAGSVHVPMNISAPDRGSAAYPSFGTTLNSDQTFAEYIVRTSALDKIQSFLLRGELRQAYHFALDEKMWAHAMVIAHGLDKDSFREVAEEFIKDRVGGEGRTRSRFCSTRQDRGVGCQRERMFEACVWPVRWASFYCRYDFESDNLLDVRFHLLPQCNNCFPHGSPMDRR